MSFALDDDQKAIRDLARGIFAATCDKEALDKLEAGGGFFSASAWQAVSQSGLAGMAVAESAGGGGLGPIEQVMVLRMVGEHVAPVPVLESAVMAAPAVAAAGDEARSEWLPRVLTGDAIATVALLEPDTRDLAAPTTVATADGLLRGTKTCVPWWGQADVIVLSATGPSGPGLWLVEKAAVSSNNAEIARQKATDGQPLAEVRLSGVSASQIGGYAELQALLDRGVLGRCAIAWGVAKMALRLTSEHARDRQQFGAPIGTFQAVSQRAGDMYIDTQAMELALLRAAFLLDPAQQAMAADLKESLLVARYFATEAGHRVVAAAQHLHGGMGFDKDYPLYRYFLWSKRLEFALGGGSAQLSRIGALIAAGRF